MLKRILAIMMVVALMGTALVNVIYAATGDTWPTDDSDNSIESIITLSSGSTVLTNTIVPIMKTGIPVFYYTNQATTYGYFASHKVTFDVDTTSTVWIGAYNNAGTWTPDPNYDVGTLSQYYSQSLSYEGTITYNHRYVVNPSTAYVVTTTENVDLSTFVACFENVPAGTYSFTYTPSQRYITLAIFIDATDDGSGGDDGSGTDTDTSASDSVYDVYYPMGEERVELWEDLLDAINNYDGSEDSRNVIYEKIDTISSWGDLLGVSMADYALNLFAEKSGLFSGVVTDFISNAEEILDLFTNGAIDSSESAYKLSDLFSDQLLKCGTVSEALFLSSVYQAWNQKLLILCLFSESETVMFDNPITDDDKEEFTSFEEKEQELISLFNLEQYKAQISIDNFTASLSANSTATLRAWLDYIINDSFFSPFITIPVSLLLVTSILGTSIVILRRRSRSAGGDE